MAMPVFLEGEPLFWVVALSHHADTGAPVPSTYLPFAKNIFVEGLHFPCVRVAQY
jgi:N-methylhydantoinase B